MNQAVQELQGTVAVVTGTASGIGAAIARRFAQAGARVCAAVHEEDERAAAMREALEDSGGIVVSTDVGREADVDALFATARRELGIPNVLVNDAGIDAGGKAVADLSLEEWERALRVNLTGPFLCSRAFIRGLREIKGRGKIVNISSVHEEIPRAGASEYCASKGGLRNLTRCLSLELAPECINVNGIAPGMILTPMNQADLDDPGKLAKDEATIPWRRGGRPEEIAELALFLSSARADYVTGSTYVMDGGLMQNQGQGA